MTYRKNRIIEKLNADQLVTSLKINCTDSIPVEIAAMCGYYDAGYFSRVFKKETGQSPAEYAEGKRARS